MTSEISEGDQVSIESWDQPVEVLEIRERHDEVLVEHGNGDERWEGLMWLQIQGEVVA